MIDGAEQAEIDPFAIARKIEDEVDKNVRPENRFDSKWWVLLTKAGYIEHGISDKQLTPDETKALRVREACLKISAYCFAVIEEKEKDPDREAALMIGYEEGYQTLEKEGITANMHVVSEDAPPSATQDDTVLSDAEYVAGQWKRLREQGVSIVQLKELDSTQSVGNLPINGIKGGPSASPLIRNFSDMAQVMNVTTTQLAPMMPRPDLRKHTPPPASSSK